MRTRDQALLMSLVVAAVMGCSSDDAPSGPGGGDVALEINRAASDSIGAGGGVITATGSNGVTYTLTIPPGALMAPVKITLTPTVRHENLPGSIEFAAGVAYAPEGLELAQPARLTATPVPAAPAGKLTAALSFEGDGDSLTLTPNGLSGATLTAFVPHFSGTSFVYGTSADLLTIAAAADPNSLANQFYMNQLIVIAQGRLLTQPFPSALPILQAWFANVILPQLQGAGTDAELILAVRDYSHWNYIAEVMLTGADNQARFPAPNLALPQLATEEAQARQAISPQLRNAIAGNNGRCLTQRSVQALLNVLFWQDWAQFLRVDVPAEQLDRQGVIGALCGRVVADQVTLADPLPVGQGVSLDIVWGVLIGSSPPVFPGDFDVDVAASGAASVAPTSGFTGAQPGGGAAQGFFTTVVTASGPSATISAVACLIVPGTTTAIPDLCGSVNVVRGSGAGGEIASITGAVRQIAAPGSVLENALESNTEIFLFREQAVTLTGPVATDISQPGTYTSSLSRGTVPAGTAVISYFLNLDPVGTSSTDRTLTGSVTFNRDILGVLTDEPTLDASDALLGVSSYPTGSSERGSGVGPGNNGADVIAWSGRTLSFTMESNRQDQIRILLRQ